MKKAMKVTSILLMVMMFVFTLNSIVMAKDPANLINNMSNANVNNTTAITNVGGQIINIITTIGIVVAVVVLLILGIKYMIGSASEKAEYKKTMIPYLVGAVLIFGASAIAKAVIGLAQNITG